MNQTREALRQTDGTMKELVSSLDKLGAPMQKLGDLAGPMRGLGALEPAMGRLGTHLEGVETNLQRLERPLENMAAIVGPLESVSGLEEPLQEIASVGRDKGKVVAVSIGFLVAWIVATFFGVYLAFRVGMRRLRRDKRFAQRLRARANMRDG